MGVVTCPTLRADNSAGLLLEQRLVTKKKRGMARRQRQQSSEKCDSNCFGISLLQTPPTRKWLEVEFRIVEALITEGSSRSVSRSNFEFLLTQELMYSQFNSASRRFNSPYSLTFHSQGNPSIYRSVSTSSSHKPVCGPSAALSSTDRLLCRRQWLSQRRLSSPRPQRNLCR